MSNLQPIQPDIAWSLAQRFRDARYAKGWSQNRAAREVGASQSAIARLEHSAHLRFEKKGFPSRELVMKVAAAYGLNPEQLVGELDILRAVFGRGRMRVTSGVGKRHLFVVG